MKCKSCDREADYGRNGACNRCYRAARLGPAKRDRLGDKPSYRAAHGRLGKASERTCVDCGKQAAHWSYNGLDPNPLTEMRRGMLMTYSARPEFYEPRCVPCHRKFDGGTK